MFHAMFDQRTLSEKKIFFEQCLKYVRVSYIDQCLLCRLDASLMRKPILRLQDAINANFLEHADVPFSDLANRNPSDFRTESKELIQV
jgi:hypothetical protein